MEQNDKNDAQAIHVPYKRVRINIKTGIQEEHIFTAEEIKRSKELGKIVLDDNAVWQPFSSLIERKRKSHDKPNTEP